MDSTRMEQLFRNLDRRTRRIERILPTLATKKELRAAIRPLATKKALRAAVKRLATKAKLRAAIRPLATKAELRAAIAPLATRAELRAAIEPLATKVELREESQRTRRHFDVVAESLRDEIRLIAEGVVDMRQRLDAFRTEVKAELSGHDRRLTRLETAH